MSRPEEVVLRIGASRWLLVAQAAVSLLSLVAIGLSRPGPAWTAACLGLLCLVQVDAIRRFRQMNALGVVRLQGDARATLLAANGAVPLQRRGGDWATRWFCLLRMEELISGRRFDCLVCRRLNGPAAYRQLLVRLRMREGRNRDNMQWT
jgi:hypothetical protein